MTQKQWIQIVGAGQMGVGIAETCLKSGYGVHLIETSASQRQKAQERLESRCSPEERASLNLAESMINEDIFIMIEAVIEDIEIKKQLWSKVSSSPHTILASNTSSYSITELAAFTKEPSQFLGIHFMNPVPKIPLVEIIPGEKTSKIALDRALDFVKSLKKIPIFSKDRPGFIVNRILLPMINEAVHVLAEGTGGAEDIDRAMTLGASHPMGPLALADLIGLDTCFAILTDLYHRLKSEKYQPSQLFQAMINKGHLGRKTGQGFYKYS